MNRLQPNVLLVIVDALRADYLDCYGQPKLITPHIDQIAQGGVIFDNAISAGSWTVPSTFSIHTGLYPYKHGYYDPRYRVARPAATLANMLQTCGYSTAAFSANGLVSPEFGFGDGFDDFYQALRPRSTRLAKINWRVKELVSRDDAGGAELAEYFTTWVSKKMLERNMPFFVYIHLMEVHDRVAPLNFAITKGKRSLLSELRQRLRNVMTPWGLSHNSKIMERLDLLKDRYSLSVQYVDHLVGSMVSKMMEAGLWQDTLVIIASDHGELLGEKQAWSHGRFLNDVLIKVPLIVSYPTKAQKPLRIGGQVQLVDIFPTIAETIGSCGHDFVRGTDGTSLWAAMHDKESDLHPVALSEHLQVESADQSPFDSSRDLATQRNAKISYSVRALRTHSFKFLRYGDGTQELYDLDTDPAETTNIVPLRPSEVAYFSAMLDDLTNGTEKEEGKVQNPVEGNEIIEARLRDLGYIE